jgi:hypothetical protein
MIDVIAKAIVLKIVGEINESGVYSIMRDETMDVSKVEQVSFCLRYVDQMGVVQERLMEMLGIDSTKVAALFDRVVTSLGKKWAQDGWNCESVP